MWATNLKVVGVVLATVGTYTLIANAIPQVESEVPEALTFSGEVTAAELVAAGQELYEGAGGCTACHGLGTRAPNLVTADASGQAIGGRCATRAPGVDCKAYLHASMIDPNAFVVEGFQPIMPDMRRTLSNEQIWALIAFLQSQGGEVTVTASDLGPPETPADASASAGVGAAGGGTLDPGAADPVAIMDGLACLACHRLDEQGQDVGPPFTDVGARLDADAIRRAILDPDAEVAPGFEQFAGIMPKDFGQRMSAYQLEAVVEYLAGRRGGAE